MVHSDNSQGKKYKPRGRPFPKGNKRGKLENGLLADSRHNIGNERGVVAPLPEQHNQEPLKPENPLSEMFTLVTNTLDHNIREAMETPKEEIEEEGAIKIVETIDFKNGDNVLSIRFSAVNNRRYRIQVFLNDETEVRPVTYQGSTSGNAFWKLLKGALKK